MCGIIGYIGKKSAVPILLEGLKKLEYRGYDSSGIGVITPTNGGVTIRKTEGKIHRLEELIQSRPCPESSLGISHTRWATHGIPNRTNAHPHADCEGKILVVHNGIIENYAQIKAFLKREGHRFVSDTDTEVIAHLVEKYLRDDLLEAVQKALKKLKGTFAVGIISSSHPDEFVAARLGSPLIVGLGRDENFIASDVPAISDYTKKIIYLEDGQIVHLKREGVRIFNLDGQRVRVKADRVNFKIDAVKRKGFAHFMLKEIHEQPDVLKQMMRARVRGRSVYLEGTRLTENELKNFKNIFIVACGTAYHAGLIGKYIIELFSGIPVSVDISSEFRYRDPIIHKDTLVVAISQSGETADTLAAVREAKARGAKVVSICNVVGSSLSRESDGVLYTHAGPEIGVASTKAYTAQLCMLYLLAISFGINRRVLSGRESSQILGGLRKIPLLYAKILKNKNKIIKIAKINSHFGCFLFLGRNINFPSALEGALKLKEISYIPAEGYAAGEMKHGPIALIDEYRAVVCIAAESDIYEKMISNIQEIKARKGKIIAIATEGNEDIKQHARNVIYIPQTHKLLTPLLVALPLQLLAYYISIERGCDVDQPRNLAKSVTVE